MKRSALPVLMSLAAFIGHAAPAQADGSPDAVQWLSVPIEVRNAVNESAPAGSSVGAVEKKTVKGQDLYDVHLKLTGGGEQVIELDKRGQKPQDPAAVLREIKQPEEPKAAEAPAAAAPAPRPARTGLEDFTDGPVEGNAEEEYAAGQHAEYGGPGARQDYAEAVKWYTKAAGHGSAAAAFSLGGLYTDALGVKQNNAEAARWYKKAAEASHPDAQYDLGQLYAKGAGVAQDYAEAWFWFSLAANNKVASAPSARDAAAAHLTPEQLAAARKRLQDWKPSAAASAPAAPKAPPVVSITPPPISEVMPQVNKTAPAITAPQASSPQKNP